MAAHGDVAALEADCWGGVEESDEQDEVEEEEDEEEGVDENTIVYVL